MLYVLIPAKSIDRFEEVKLQLDSLKQSMEELNKIVESSKQSGEKYGLKEMMEEIKAMKNEMRSEMGTRFDNIQHSIKNLQSRIEY
jgi:hypothetical protein